MKILKEKIIIYSNDKTLIGLSTEEKNKVINELTFFNPQYEQVKKFSPYAYTNVPKYLEYYSYNRATKEMRVPIGYDTSFIKFDKIEDERNYPIVEKFPEFKLELREAQKKAVEKYLKANLNNNEIAGNVEIPTGIGKTVTALYLASELKTRTLVLVHKLDLVTGWRKDVEKAFNSKADVKIIQGKNRSVGKHFTIATVQTLNRMSEEDLQKLFEHFGLVIGDENHLTPSSTFSIISKFNSRYKIGLSATPERKDKLEFCIELYFGKYFYRHDKKDIGNDILQVEVDIKTNYSVYFNPVCKRTMSNTYKVVDYFKPFNAPLEDDEIRISDIPYNLKPKVPFLNIDTFIVKCVKKSICEEIKNEYEKNQSIICFFSQKEFIDLYYEYLTEVLKVKKSDIGLLYGDNPKCDEVLENAEKKRKFITLATYSKATEGTNVRQWEVLFFISSNNNGKTTEQAIGRIRRTKDNLKNPKAKVFDYYYPNVYTVRNHIKTRIDRYKLLGFDVYKDNERINFIENTSKENTPKEDNKTQLEKVKRRELIKKLFKR